MGRVDQAPGIRPQEPTESLGPARRGLMRSHLRPPGAVSSPFMRILWVVALFASASSARNVGFLAHAVAADERGEAADDPLPEIAPRELAARIAEARKRYSAGLIVVEFEEERDGPLKFPGRFRHASAGRLWRAEFDSMTVGFQGRKLVPDRWTSGFDGTRHYTWRRRGQEVVFGEAEIGATALTPADLFYRGGDTLIESLSKPGARVGQRTVDGMRCYVVEQTTTTPETTWRTEYLIAPRRSYLILGLAHERGGRRYFSHRLHDLKEAGRGLWAPGRITSGNEPKADGRLATFDIRRSMRVVGYEPSRTFAEGEFRLAVPMNADVADLATGTSYRNDPWWPEIGKLLRERFDWPRPDISRLDDLQTYGEPEVLGRTAPAIAASSWVDSGPIDRDTLRGRVVLIDFTALEVRRNVVPGLRKLAEAYGPAGLVVISVLSPRNTPDDVRQFVRELRIAHPVAIDRPVEKGYGATRAAFGMESEVSTFLVDRAGTVHKVTQGRLIEDLVRLLRQGHAGKVEPLSPENSGFSDEMSRAVDRAWKGWVGQALPAGTIVGTITDASGRPVVDARVRARIEAMVLTSSSGHFRFQGSTEHTVTARPDGSFAVPALCKGNYTLRVTAPGLAVVERPALIESVPGGASVHVIMAQTDAIAGRVVDEAGKPVEAEVILSERRLPHPDGTETHFNDFLEGRATDADGRFRFGGLPEGTFTLRVKGKGFVEQRREQVPAGADGLELRIPRTGTK